MEEYTLEQLRPHGILVDGVPELYPPFGTETQWVVAEAFRYISRDGWLIPVLAKFETDLASIPKWLRSIFGVNKRETVGAVVHDFGYRNKYVMIYNVITDECRVLTRFEWDTILRHLMILGQTKRIRLEAIYEGVRAGGWWTWRKN